MTSVLVFHQQRSCCKHHLSQVCFKIVGMRRRKQPTKTQLASKFHISVQPSSGTRRRHHRQRRCNTYLALLAALNLVLGLQFHASVQSIPSVWHQLELRVANHVQQLVRAQDRASRLGHDPIRRRTIRWLATTQYIYTYFWRWRSFNSQ